MSKTSRTNLLQVLKNQAEQNQSILEHFRMMSITDMNYFYVDYRSQKVTFTGTEAYWLAFCVEEGLLQQIQLRLTLLVHVWEEPSTWFQAYTQYCHQQSLNESWLKTDLCLEGQHGYHVLELKHLNPLNLYQMNPLFEAIGLFKDASIRLQNQHAMLTCALVQPVSVPQAPPLPTKPLFDLDQIQEADPIPLNALELQALDLRVMWHEDDEIAKQMKMSVAQVRQLFRSIAEKYHQFDVPPSVYHDRVFRLQHVFVHVDVPPYGQ